MPTQRTQLDGDALGYLTQAFANYRSVTSANVQSVLNLPSETLVGSVSKKVPVIAMVACPVDRLGDAVDALDFDARLTLFKTLLDALSGLHRASLVHGNLHPGAVRSETPSGNVKLCDIVFAQPDKARIVDQPLPYQSGQLIQSGNPTIQSDLYALGMIGYRLFLGPGGAERVVTGQVGARDDAMLRQRALDGRFDTVTKDQLNPADPESARYLAPVLRRMVGQTEMGFENAADARQALTPSEPVGPGGPPPGLQPPPSPPQPPESKRTWQLILLLSAGIVGIGGYLVYDRITTTAAREAFLDDCRDIGTLPVALDGAVSEFNTALEAAVAAQDSGAARAACDMKETLQGLPPIASAAADMLDRFPPYEALQSRQNLAVPADQFDALTSARDTLSDSLAAFGLQDGDVVTAVTNAAGEALEAHHGHVQASLAASRDRHVEDLQTLGARFRDLGDLTAIDTGVPADAAALGAAGDTLTEAVDAARETRRDVLSAAFAERIGAHASRLAEIGAPEAAQTAAQDVLADAEDTFIAAMTPFPADPQTVLDARRAAQTEADEAFATAERATLAVLLTQTSDALATLRTASAPDTVAADALALRLEALGEDKRPFAAIAGDVETLRTDIASARADVEAKAVQARAGFAAAKTRAEVAEGPAQEALTEVADGITKAEADAENGALRMAALAYLEATGTVQTAIDAMQSEVDERRASATSLTEQAEAAGLPEAAEARERLDAAAATAEDGRLQSGSDQLDALASFIRDAFDAFRTGPRPFAVGASASDLAALRALCTNSRVPASCPSAPLNASPATEAPIGPFSLDATEATVGAFAAFVDAQGHTPTAQPGGDVYVLYSTGAETFPGAAWNAPNGPGTTAQSGDPVTALSGTDAAAFCAAQGKRLPTWAEWQAAARGADGSLFGFGDWRANGAVWQGNGAARSPAAQAPGGAAGGFVHLSGNVREWVADDNGTPIGVAGGSWLSVHPHDLSAVTLLEINASRPGLDFGVRCAKDLEEWPQD